MIGLALFGIGVVILSAVLIIGLCRAAKRGDGSDYQERG